jgi:DNA ligase-1
VIIDGEILTARGEEILPFADLQKRLGRKVISAEMLASTPVVFVAWDLLYASGKVLIDEPLRNRRAQVAGDHKQYPRHGAPVTNEII